MDINAMIDSLKTEKKQLDEAILILERLQDGLGNASSRADRAFRPRQFSAQSRQRMAEAQKKRWAAKRAAASPGTE